MLNHTHKDRIYTALNTCVLLLGPCEDGSGGGAQEDGLHSFNSELQNHKPRPLRCTQIATHSLGLKEVTFRGKKSSFMVSLIFRELIKRFDAEVVFVGIVSLKP